MSTKNSSDTTGNRTRDLQAWRTLPQPTVPPSVPTEESSHIKSSCSRSTCVSLCVPCHSFWVGHALNQAVIRPPLAAENRIQFQAIPVEIYDGRGGPETGSLPRPLVVLCQFHSTNAPHSFTHQQHYIILANDCAALSNILKNYNFGTNYMLRRKRSL
jgi:hypothetical protein